MRREGLKPMIGASWCRYGRSEQRMVGRTRQQGKRMQAYVVSGVPSNEDPSYTSIYGDAMPPFTSELHGFHEVVQNALVGV